MEGVSFHRLVILLVFFHLVISSSNAIPSTRTWGMARDNLEPEAFSDAPQSTYDDGTAEEVLRGRLELESNDYPGSGANNRHTPPGRRLK